MPVESLHKNPLPKSAQKYVELRGDCADKESKADHRPRKRFRERHDKSEAYKHRDVNILISRIPAWIEIISTITLEAGEDSVKHNNSDLGYE